MGYGRIFGVRAMAVLTGAVGVSLLSCARRICGISTILGGFRGQLVQVVDFDGCGCKARMRVGECLWADVWRGGRARGSPCGRWLAGLGASVRARLFPEAKAVGR